ncbi:MAG: TauD/TfdA family dioxygenase [Betaproteobacteria bacterium]|nr:TauD/TfdA family dioxygenase [Betaproteobacteria bacterium]
MEPELRPVHPVFGAELRGVDLRVAPTPELVDRIDRAMDQYAVLVIRGQDIDDDQQLAFARAFGRLEPTPAVVDGNKRRLKHGEMVDISNLEVDGSIIAADDRRRMFNLGNLLWHSDSSFKATPAKYSMLHARVVPPEGGQTEYADMRAAWDALPEDMQKRLEPLVCDHSLIYSRALLGFDAFNEAELKDFAPVPQRLVRRHPGSGRRSLFLSSHIGTIHGWPRPEAMALIRDLTEHATGPAFTYRHEWRAGDLVIWDNRCTMHRARPFDDRRYRRDLRRLTLEDSAPSLQQAA